MVDKRQRVIPITINQKEFAKRLGFKTKLVEFNPELNPIAKSIRDLPLVEITEQLISRFSEGSKIELGEETYERIERLGGIESFL